MFIVVMGVSGCGKSTLGSALAKELALPFYDADDLHPQHNVEKMSRGEPLTDADREPWLEIVRTTAHRAVAEQHAKGVVTACSALKRYYRDILRGPHQPKVDPSSSEALPTYFVFIMGSRELILERMTSRQGHFMKGNMLDSQLQALESPEGEERVLTVHLEDPTEKQVLSVKSQLSAFFSCDLD